MYCVSLLVVLEVITIIVVIVKMIGVKWSLLSGNK